MKDTTPEKAIKKRMNNNKQLIVEQLKKTPIVQVACEKIGVGRATYYRWRKEDPEFTKLSDKALQEGSLLVNDMAESQLMSAIRDKNLTAIIFWLKHHHNAYTTRVEITTNQKTQEDILNDEQRELLTRALAMAKLIPDKITGTERKDKDDK